MARKKKRKAPAKPKPKEQAFNAPFAGLGQALKKAATAPPRPARPDKAAPGAASEQELFASAMAGVERLPPARRPAPKQAPPNPARIDEPVDEELEVMAHLAELVSGAGEFDLRMSDEYVRGSQPGVGPELMERLAGGAFPIQDHIDLHGLTLEQAEAEAAEFIAGAVARGLRHVLIVHGRGKGSPGGVPVLKKALAAALGAKRFRRSVLAFCTAQPMDGGAGAMYLLLRRWSGPKQTKW